MSILYWTGCIGFEPIKPVLGTGRLPLSLATYNKTKKEYIHKEYTPLINVHKYYS